MDASAPAEQEHVHHFQEIKATHHWRCLKLCSPSLSVISAAFMAFGRSCLLAKTSNKASLNSSSLSIRCNSSRASETRSRSLESTTKMIPWVFWKSGEVKGKDKGSSCKTLPVLQTRKNGCHLQCLHNGRILSCPPTSHTVKEMFLYSTVSTLNPNERKGNGNMQGTISKAAFSQTKHPLSAGRDRSTAIERYSMIGNRILSPLPPSPTVPWTTADLAKPHYMIVVYRFIHRDQLTDCGNRGDNFTELELVKNGCNDGKSVQSLMTTLPTTDAPLARYSLVLPAASKPTIKIPAGEQTSVLVVRIVLKDTGAGSSILW
jgi:hypothetical protein